MTEKRRFVTGKASLRAAGIAVAAGAVAAIYVTLEGQGNGAGDTACAAAKPVAASLDPLIHGEVAAFQLARAPEKLSGLTFTDTEGQPAMVGAFTGKVTLVNLWATWCGPCRKEMPALDGLQAALGGDDFAVVPISIDTGDPERPAAFLESIGTKHLPLYTDPSTEIFEELKKRSLALGLPVTLLLDRNGCRLGHMNGPAEWDSEEGKRLIEAAIGAGEA
ncbi:MAG TPA: TlpA disulfide reductase family protein [Propylenella sp.]|nr:TlpA disulfide reductase family protein [Propylenella sp.]